jgi:hypothetical protein
MAFNSDMYFNQRGAADLAGGFEQGMSLGQMIKKNRLQNQEEEEGIKIKDIFKNNFKQGADGKYAVDRENTLKGLYEVNPEKAMMMEKDWSSQDMMRDKNALNKQELEYEKGFKERELGQKDRALSLQDKELGFNKLLASQKEGAGKGQDAVDRDYAKNFGSFATKGYVNSGASINKLENIIKELEADQGLGEASGTKLPIPDMFRASAAIRRRDDSVNAANSTLKELFPGALSDGERIAAAKEYYNDKLGAKENAALLRGKVEQLKEIRRREIEKARHFQQRSTLAGYTLDETPITAFKAGMDNQSPEIPGIGNANAFDMNTARKKIKDMSDEELSKYARGE